MESFSDESSAAKRKLNEFDSGDIPHAREVMQGKAYSTKCDKMRHAKTKEFSKKCDMQKRNNAVESLYDESSAVPKRETFLSGKKLHGFQMPKEAILGKACWTKYNMQKNNT